MEKKWTTLRLTRLMLQIIAVVCIFLPYFIVEDFGVLNIFGVDIIVSSPSAEIFLDAAENTVTFLKVSFAIPLGGAVFAAIITILNGKTLSKVFGIIHALVQLLSYGLWVIAFMATGGLSGVGVGLWVQAFIPIVLIVVIVMDRKKVTVTTCVMDGGSEGEILGLNGTYSGAKIPVSIEGLIIGRDAKLCNVVIDNEKVSRKHCTIIYDTAKKTYFLVDHSTNGIFKMDGTRIDAQNGTELARGEEICIGNADNSFALL